MPWSTGGLVFIEGPGDFACYQVIGEDTRDDVVTSQDAHTFTIKLLQTSTNYIVCCSA